MSAVSVTSLQTHTVSPGSEAEVLHLNRPDDATKFVYSLVLLVLQHGIRSLRLSVTAGKQDVLQSPEFDAAMKRLKTGLIEYGGGKKNVQAVTFAIQSQVNKVITAYKQYLNLLKDLGVSKQVLGMEGNGTNPVSRLREIYLEQVEQGGTAAGRRAVIPMLDLLGIEREGPIRGRVFAALEYLYREEMFLYTGPVKHAGRIIAKVEQGQQARGQKVEERTFGADSNPASTAKNRMLAALISNK